MERGDWKNAASLFMAARDARPDEPVSYYNLGLCMMQASQAGVLVKGKETFSEAIEHFRTALALKLDYAEAWLALGKTLGMAATSRAEDATEARRSILETAALGAFFAAAALDQGTIKRAAIAHLMELRSYEGVCFKQQGQLDAGVVFSYAVACAACCEDARPDKAHRAFFEDYSRAGMILSELVHRATTATAPSALRPRADLPPFPPLIVITMYYDWRMPKRDDSRRLIRALSGEVPFLQELGSRAGI